jgi:DNA-binding LacI/PurR family transcriptional regulator
MPLRTAKPRRRQISQKLIASEAGVSQSTVSLVLSGRSVSSDGTRRRVLEAAERLRYRPNLLVHAMQTGKTRMIGVMAPPFDFYWSEVLYGIHDQLVSADHVPITLWPYHRGSGPRDRTQPGGHVLEQIHRLIDRRVDGVILWPPFATLYQDHIQEFSSRDLPVVTIDHELPTGFGADFVGSDEAMGGRLVANHLYHQGHRRIGHLAGPAVATWAVARRRAFEEALRGFDDAHCVTVEAPPGETAFGNEPARRLLTSPARPTAIYAASDLYAKEVYRAARDLGLRVPQDVSVVGFSDDDFAAEMEPPLTTVRQPAYAIGRKAAELVLGRAAQRRKPVQARLGVELIVRRSTMAPAFVAVPSRAAISRSEASYI